MPDSTDRSVYAVMDGDDAARAICSRDIPDRTHVRAFLIEHAGAEIRTVTVDEARRLFEAWIDRETARAVAALADEDAHVRGAALALGG